MFARYCGRSAASFDICVATPQPARASVVKTSATVIKTARMRPIRR